MSLQASPPPASIAIAWTSTFAPVVQRGALSGSWNRGGELVAEPEPVRERTQSMEPDVGNDAAPSGSDNDGPRAGTFHLGDAFRCRWTVVLGTNSFPYLEGIFADTRRSDHVDS